MRIYKNRKRMDECKVLGLYSRNRHFDHIFKQDRFQPCNVFVCSVLLLEVERVVSLSWQQELSTII